MGGEEKAETGDWRPERKGRATGEGRGDFGWWIMDVGLAVLLRAARLRRDKVAGEILDFGSNHGE